MGGSRVKWTILVAVIAILGVSVASAQWALLARRAIGRVEQMSQPQAGDVPGYAVATVVIEGNADKVYATALKTIQANANASITAKDPASHTINVTDGAHAVGLRISQVNDEVVYLLVAAGATPDHDRTTSVVVAAVLRVCKEAGATCSVAQ